MEDRSVDYFSKVFEAPLRPLAVAPHSYQWIVSNEMNAWLDHKPSESEVKKVLFSLPRLKHLGMMGSLLLSSRNSGMS